MSETVEISVAELNQLKDDALLLSCLRAGGVDNWDYWDDAIEEYNKAKGE